ncbi:hypothetical protein AHAS_Ahas13G0275200 [Arachis hypogaea]
MITLEDVAMIFELRTHGLPVTGSTDHSTSGLENKCMTQFGSAPSPNDHRSEIKLAWFRTLKWPQHLTDRFSWSSACLAHIYQSLCWVSRWNDYQLNIEEYKKWTTANVGRRLDNLSLDRVRVLSFRLFLILN